MISVRPVPSNTLSPIYSRLLGSVMEVKDEQPWNTELTMYFVPEFSVTLLNDVQPSKPPLMVMTVPGMLMLVRAVQFLKAPSLMSVTLLPSVTEVRWVQPAKVLLSTELALKLTVARLEHPWKASPATVVALTLSVVSPVQPWKALLIIVVALTVRAVKPVQLAKALSPIVEILFRFVTEVR